MVTLVHYRIQGTIFAPLAMTLVLVATISVLHGHRTFKMPAARYVAMKAQCVIVLRFIESSCVRYHSLPVLRFPQ